MSPDDIQPSSVEVDGLGEQFTAEEQAAFDAMRAGGEVTPPPEPTSTEPPPAEPPKAGEPPPAPPPAPSDDDDIEVAAPVSGTKQKRVSIHKYQRLEQRAREAEEARDAAAKERQELLDRAARTDERLRIITEAIATPPEQPQEREEDDDPRPDPAKDIFAFVDWQDRQINKLNARLSGIESGAASQTEDVEIASTYQRDAARFASTEPAFAEAYVYLIRQRDAELQLAGVTDQKARERQIVNEEKGLVRGAIKQGRSPAELIFSMAKGRGYAPKAAPPPDTKDPKALDATVKPTNGSAPPAAAPAGGSSPPPAAPAVSVTDEIAAIKRGQEASASLSNVGGGAPVRELTSKVLADMPEEEFNDLVARLPRERLMELMGN